MNFRLAVLPIALMLSMPTLALAARGFDARDMAKMDRVSSPALSPDGRKAGVRQAHRRLRCQQGHDGAVHRGPVRARCRAAGAFYARGLERQFAIVLARWQDRLFPERENRRAAALRDAGRRRRSTTTDRSRTRCRQLQAVARWQAGGARRRDLRGLQGRLRLQQEARRRQSREEKQRRGLRPHVHPPLGRMERRQAQPPVRGGAAGRQGEGADGGDGDRRRRRRRRAVQAVRRHQRVRMGPRRRQPRGQCAQGRCRRAVVDQLRSLPGQRRR